MMMAPPYISFHTIILDMSGVCFVDLMGTKALGKVSSVLQTYTSNISPRYLLFSWAAQIKMFTLLSRRFCVTFSFSITQDSCKALDKRLDVQTRSWSSSVINPLSPLSLLAVFQLPEDRD